MSLDDGTEHPENDGEFSLTEEEFEALVVDELDALPDEMVEGLDNVIFVTEARPEDGSLDLLGLYEGVALTDRGQYGFGELPDRIILFREPLIAHAEGDLEELREQGDLDLQELSTNEPCVLKEQIRNLFLFSYARALRP